MAKMYCDNCHREVVKIPWEEKKVIGVSEALLPTWKHSVPPQNCNRFNMTDEQITDVDWERADPTD